MDTSQFQPVTSSAHRSVSPRSLQLASRVSPELGVGALEFAGASEPRESMASSHIVFNMTLVAVYFHRVHLLLIKHLLFFKRYM